MRRLIVIALLALALVGCSTDESGNSALQSVKGYTVKLPDGGSVVCVVFSGTSKGGIDCDWESR